MRAPNKLRIVQGWSPSDLAERRMIRRYKRRRALVHWLKHDLVDLLGLVLIALLVSAAFTLFIFEAGR